jgi:acyl carrier protein
MSREDVLAKLQTVFDRVFFTGVRVTPELSAKDVEEWDSLTQISLIVAVQGAFHVKFLMGEVEKLKNVGEFADLILKRMT